MTVKFGDKLIEAGPCIDPNKIAQAVDMLGESLGNPTPVDRHDVGGTDPRYDPIYLCREEGQDPIIITPDAEDPTDTHTVVVGTGGIVVSGGSGNVDVGRGIRYQGTDIIDDYYDKPILNVTSPQETIPAYAVVQIKGADDVGPGDTDTTFHVEKTTPAGEMFLINGPTPIDPGGVGHGTRSMGARVLYDNASVPQTGELWHAQNNSWSIHKSGSRGRFRVLGDADGILVRVDPKPFNLPATEMRLAIIGLEIDACVYDGTSDPQPGYSDVAASLLVQPALPGSSWATQGLPIPVLNFSRSKIRTDTIHPGWVAKFSGQEVFIALHVDLSNLLGHTNVEPQAPYHEATDDGYQVGRGECQLPQA